MIYKMSFRSVEVKIHSFGYRAHNPGILAACHQSRAEALKAYYNHTSFYLRMARCHYDFREALAALKDWIRSLPVDSADHLRHVMVSVQLYLHVFQAPACVDRCRDHYNQELSIAVNKLPLAAGVLGPDMIQAEEALCSGTCKLHGFEYR